MRWDVALHVDIEAAMRAGIEFFMSGNGVVLTEGPGSVVRGESFGH